MLFSVKEIYQTFILGKHQQDFSQNKNKKTLRQTAKAKSGKSTIP